MTRRAPVFLALATLVASLFGAAGPVAAATPDAVDDGPIVVQRNAAATAIDVLANDTVAADATITGATAPAHGAVAVAADGRSLTYDPAQGYDGPDTFSYTVSDPNEPAETATDTATVTIRVNDPPVSVDNPSAACDDPASLTFAMPEDMDEFVAGGVCRLIANDTDSDGTVVNWVLVDPPDHGAVANELPGTIPGFSSDFSYVPDADYFTKRGDEPGGSWVSDSFTYRAVDNDGATSGLATVRFWIAPVNDAPSFTPGASTVTGREGTAYSQPWASAISPGPANEASQAVHFELDAPVSNPGLFSVAPAISATGRLTFTPAPGQSGSASVTFVAKDDGGLEDYGGNAGGATADDTSNPVTFTISVTANDAPVAVNDPAIPGCTSNAFGGAYRIIEDDDQIVLTGSCAPTVNDSDGDGTIASWQVDAGPQHGALAWLSSQPDSFGYTPAANYFTPAGTWTSDSFTYHVIDNDGAASNTATYRFWIAPVNDAPTFTPGPASVGAEPGVPFDGAWASSISPGPNESSQDVDFERTALDLHGNAGLFSVSPTLAADGSLSFTAAAGQAGTATVTFVAKDDGGLEHYDGVPDTADDTSNPVSFNIVITPGNSAPSAIADTATVPEDAGPTNIDVLANDSDGNNDPLTVTTKTNGTKGVVAIVAGGGSVTYKPNAQAYGSDTFTYRVSDDHGASSVASVTVTITPSNDPPNAVNDGVPTPYNIYLKAAPRPLPVLANDTWLPDAPETLKFTSVTQGGHGTVAITGGGTGLTYAAKGSSTGIDLFTYTISDGHGGFDTATTQVTVKQDKAGPRASIITVQKSTIPGRPRGLRIYVKWSLSDPETGLAGQLLQRRTGSGAWVTVALSTVGTRAAAFALPKGHTYTFRVRGTDRAGNVGVFASRQIRI